MMFEIEKPCPQCGNQSTFAFSERIIGAELSWFASHWCSVCDFALEIDSQGKLPDELRQIVLKETGLWELTILNINSLGLKILHQLLGISLQELAKLKNNLPYIITTGTKTELTYLQTQIQKRSKTLTVSLHEEGKSNE